MARVDLPDGNDDELIRLYSLSPAMGAAAGNFTAAVQGLSLIHTCSCPRKERLQTRWDPAHYKKKRNQHNTTQHIATYPVHLYD